jgi:putative endonuclease
MAKHLRLGKKAEQLATDFLRRRGYYIRDKNYRSGPAEVDIIAQKTARLHFIEIKSKHSLRFGEPEEQIGKGKVRRYHQAAESFQLEEKWHGEIQFDTISITFFPQAVKIEHFEDAFS